MKESRLRTVHGDRAVDMAIRFLVDPQTKVLFPDLTRLYKALKGERDGLRASQVVLVGQILRELVDGCYYGDAQTAVYLLKAINTLLEDESKVDSEETSNV